MKNIYIAYWFYHAEGVGTMMQQKEAQGRIN